MRTLLGRRRKPPTAERVRSGLPLAPNEERYVLTEAMSPLAYINPSILGIRGTLDRRRFDAALREVCQRHEVRRTGYEMNADGVFTRYVEARADPPIDWIDAPGATNVEIQHAVRRWFEKGPLDLTPAALTRFLVVKAGADDFYFIYHLHHALTDGITAQLFCKEVFDAYAGRALDPQVRQYSDVWNWDWRNSPQYHAAERYWIETLGSATGVGELPEDGGEREIAEWTGPVVDRLPQHLVDAAAQAAKEIGVTEFTLYYAVALVLLTRLAGQPRVCSTFQSAGRRKMPESDGVQGVFSNALILATEVDESENIAELADRLRGEIRGALAHEIYPYHHVIRATGLHPHFGMNWLPERVEYEAPGLEMWRPPMRIGRSEHDLNFRFARQPGVPGYELVIFFREEAYRRSRVQAIAAQYAALLERLVADVRAPISATRSADLAPRGLLPDPSEPLPKDAGDLIQAGFLRQAAARPDRTALVFRGDTYSYGELERRTRVLAGQLQGAGVAAGDRVGIVAERGPELVWTMLAAARLGAPFVVLDSAYPEARLKALLEICAPKALVPAGGRDIGNLADRLAAACRITAVPPDLAAADADAAGLDQGSPEDPAYILFTSGSTGQPKGVACSHAPLARFTGWQAAEYGLTADDRFSMLAGLSHDPLLRDVFTPLSLGATLAIPEAATVTEPGALAGWFRAERVSVAHITPALGQVLLAGAPRVRSLKDLRRMFWGGDILPPELVRRIGELAPGVAQVNFYGATETPQAIAAFACDGDLGRRAVPVGKGVNGAQLLVVDTARAPVGLGEVGEIAVRSNFLSLGYVKRGKVSPADDRGVDGLGRPSIYYTGDRGLYLPSGDVLLLGRADDQVKIRGHRVELAEITGALADRPEVGEAVALAVGEGPGLRIAAFVTAARRGPPPSEAELLAALGARLPGYMLPRAIHVLPRLPLLPNGKVDRQALKALAEETPETPTSHAAAAAANETERVLIEKWTGVLGEVGVSRQSSFAALGGDSLSYVQAYLATEEVIGVVPTGWQSMTIAELAALERKTAGFLTFVDTPMLVRAMSIALVVIGHMKLKSYGGGATAGLMVVSGFLFGSFQLAEVFARQSAQPILRGLRRLFVPVMLFSVFLFVAKTLAGKHPDLSVLLLYGNFQDYSKLSGPHWGGHEFYLWFIYCMLQMMALLYLGTLLLGRLNGFGIGRMGYALTLFGAGCFGRFVLPAFFVPDFFTQGLPGFTAWSFSPTAHLATLMLGALIAIAQTTRERAAVLATLAAYSALSAHLYGSHSALITLGGGLLIFTARRLPLPRPLTSLVLLLSGASLYIYLTHFLTRSVLRHLGAPEWPLLHVLAGLAVGVAAWAVWVWISARFARAFRQGPAAEPQPAL